MLNKSVEVRRLAFIVVNKSLRQITYETNNFYSYFCRMIKLLRNILLTLISMLFLMGSGGIYFVVHHCSGSGETSIHFLQNNGCCGESNISSVCNTTYPVRSQHKGETLSNHSCCSNTSTFLITDKLIKPSNQESPLIFDFSALYSFSYTALRITPTIVVTPNYLYSQGPPITYDIYRFLNVFRV